MIVSENTPPSPLKDTTPNLPHSQSSNINQDPPPSYGAAQTSQRSPLVQPHAGPSHIIAVSHPGQSPLKRFLKAFLVAALIWALVGLFIGTSVNVRTRKQERATYDIPKDIHLQNCVEGPDMDTSPLFPFASQNASEQETSLQLIRVGKSYELPLSSKNLFLLSREQRSLVGISRTFNIKSSPDLRADIIKVDVRIMTQRHDLLARVKTCHVSRRKEENGVGIFVLPYPQSSPFDGWLSMEVVVTVPEVGWDPLRIKSFETDLPQFQHLLDSTADFVEFDKLSLKSSNALIQAKSLKVHDQVTIHTSNNAVQIESLVAKNAQIETSNGPITGTYEATGSLSLKTSDKKIEVEVKLTSSDKKGNLWIKNSNGPIDAHVDLISADTHRAQDDVFTVSAITSNSDLLFDLLSLPYESSLKLEAKTSNDNAKVKLPQTFEGRFTLETSNNVPSMERHSERDHDPAGRGRTRQLDDKSRLRNFWQGNVYWDKDHESLSDAKIRTSNGKAILVL